MVLGLILMVMIFLVSCSSGVDVSTVDRVLTSFRIEWPNDFTGTAYSDVPMEVRILSYDQLEETFN